MKDLFGRELTPAEATVAAGRKRKSPIPRGYAAPPGTGPEGETCKTCKHLKRLRMSKTYLKCDLMRRAWTRSGGTDIRARSPACKRWEKGTV